METLAFLQTSWYVIIGILLAGYAILDGFDLGAGALLPFLARDDEEKLSVFNSIWPFWDGNEVWLVTGGAALFAAFPHAYATVFSGFYLALMLVLFALIFRAVAMEFWYYDEKRRALWSGAFIAGSLLPSLLFGVALGNVIIGVPLAASMDFTGNFFTLLRPYPLAIGLLGFSAILMQGVTFIAMKTDGAVQKRARVLFGKVWTIFIAALALSFAVTVVYMPESLTGPYVWVAAVVVITAWLLCRRFASAGKTGLSFAMSSLSFAGLWGIVGATHFPNLVKASGDAALSITMYNASSGEKTLTVMLWIALIGMPIVILYTTFVYRIFRGKVITAK
ncbi:MAG: cytochrome d ubiquinol oxidase subunit II [Spirochaetes bacterium]|jgi:cytochrome d ubiquinol oxidase subunit II|nr:cytochrome d ubiquinol oxidase subunit II [Spirochaetota bacterium]